MRLQVTTSTAARERRLETLLAGRDPSTLGMPALIEQAQAAGSLELAGRPQTPEDLERLRQAIRAVPRDAPLSLQALAAWHGAVIGGRSAFRKEDISSSFPNAAPPEFIESRLKILEQWLSADSRRELSPGQAGALVLARL